MRTICNCCNQTFPQLCAVYLPFSGILSAIRMLRQLPPPPSIDPAANEVQECSPMRLIFWLIIVTLTCGRSLPASDGQEAKPEKATPVGYIICSDRENDHFASMLLDICKKLPAGRISCGETVNVVQRHGDWLEIALPDNRPRYLPANMVSQSADKFVPFDRNSGVEDKGAVDCPVPPAPREFGPRAIYAPDPEYTEKARRMKISGTVVLSLIVGIDGLPRDVKVEKGLGYGLDEKALEAARKWKFQPAVKDGQPFEKQIRLSMSFRLY